MFWACRSLWISQSWNYTQLEAAMWVLGPTCRSYARAVTSLNGWAIFPALALCSQQKLLYSRLCSWVHYTVNVPGPGWRSPGHFLALFPGQLLNYGFLVLFVCLFRSYLHPSAQSVHIGVDCLHSSLQRTLNVPKWCLFVFLQIFSQFYSTLDSILSSINFYPYMIGVHQM